LYHRLLSNFPNYNSVDLLLAFLSAWCVKYINAFTLGFAEADKAWAEWISWVLESAGYTIEQKADKQAYQLDINKIPGQHFLPIWSRRYLENTDAQHQNDQILMNYDRGEKTVVLPIQIDNHGLFSERELITPLNLLNCDRILAQQKLLKAARSLPLQFNPPPQAPFRKPQPPFPGELSGGTPRKERGTAQGYIEKLTDGVQIEMMQIPGGMFTMGAAEGEEGSHDPERPTHRVKVPPFCMGRYPVTQAQWRFVAGLSQINRKLDRDPARFKGDDKPIERVSWLEATEFCARLSQHTDREYRLPTESDWEYACRGKTTTPFHFGQIIDPEVANYRGSSVYSQGRKGLYREETTPVGFFKVANAFGLYDMHGNVWEWCMDHWHDSYKGASSDGSAWLDARAKKDAPRVLRGGSWFFSPADCRSASRDGGDAVNRDSHIGFRLVSPARILP
jgi:formylglycine-generating enzyme required for sulfatase activity